MSNMNDVEKVLEILPNLNCGACGYGSCEEMASKIVKDPEEINKCVNLSQDTKSAFLKGDDCCGCGGHCDC